MLSKTAGLEPEEYHLTVTNESVKVEGGSRAGILHGVRSLCQIIACSAEYGGLDRAIPVGCIIDKPRFAYRGLMLDSGRHFQKKEVILTLLDEMSRYKLNVFHWHISDRQGWRLPLKCFPELTEKMPHSRCYSHGVYTREDIEEIRRYAKEREIEIIPEIEMPGHSGTVFLTHPELACPVSPDPFADDFWEYCLGNPGSASFLRRILKETAELFPESRIIHLGGDEASVLHWEQCPVCRKKMKSLKLKNIRELESWFMAEREKDILKLGLRAMTWGKHEGSYEKFSGKMILQNWLEKDVSKLAATGLDIVNSYNPENFS
jgi:hexosaminidase